MQASGACAIAGYGAQSEVEGSDFACPTDVIQAGMSDCGILK